MIHSYHSKKSIDITYLTANFVSIAVDRYFKINFDPYNSYTTLFILKVTYVHLFLKIDIFKG